MSIWRHADKTVVFISERVPIPPNVMQAIFDYARAAEPESDEDVTEVFARLLKSLEDWHRGEILQLASWMSEAKELRIMRDASQHKTHWTHVGLSAMPEKGGTVP